MQQCCAWVHHHSDTYRQGISLPVILEPVLHQWFYFFSIPFASNAICRLERIMRSPSYRFHIHSYVSVSSAQGVRDIACSAAWASQ